MSHSENKSEDFITRIRPHLEFWGLELLILGLIPAGVVAYLEHIKSVWAEPVLYGMGAGLMCSGIWVAIRAGAYLPPRSIRPNTKNIEACVRSWLDTHRVGIKNDPSPESYFRFRITFDSGKVMTVVRMRDQPDYVQILADMSLRGDDKKLLEQLNEEEIGQILWDVRVELARAQVGYVGLIYPPENFIISRRIPIHHNLTEFIFISMLGSVEAAMNLIGLMFFKTKSEADRRKGASPARSTPQLVSGTPKLEPPIA
jgi:hypothetical protein